MPCRKECLVIMEEKSVILDNKEYVYDSDNPLGYGASYTSFIARESKTGARKILKINKINRDPSSTVLFGFDNNNHIDKGVIDDLLFYNNTANLSAYLNNHIVQADFYEQYGDIYVIQDYSNGIILADLNKITYKNFIDIVYQISKIVLELSSNSILLLDLKLSNFIYLTNSNTVKLFDYDAIINKERLCIENISDINKIFLKTTLSLAAPEVTFCYDLIDKANKKRYVSCDEFKKIKYALSNINDYSVTYMMGGSIENLFNRIEIVNYDLDFETKKTVNYIIKSIINLLTTTRLHSYGTFLAINDLKRFIDIEYCDFEQLAGMPPMYFIEFTSHSSYPILKTIEDEYLSYCAKIINKRTVHGNIRTLYNNLKNKGDIGPRNGFIEYNALLDVFTNFKCKMYDEYKNCDHYELYKEYLSEYEYDFFAISKRALSLNYLIRFNNEIYHLETCHIHKLPGDLLSFYKGKVENILKLINSNDLYCYYYYILAKAYELEFNFKESIDLLLKCKELFPVLEDKQQLEINYLLFSRMVIIGGYKEAIEILEEVIELNKDIKYFGYFDCYHIEKIDDVWAILICLSVKTDDINRTKKYVNLYLNNANNLEEQLNRAVFVAHTVFQIIDEDEILSKNVLKNFYKIGELTSEVELEYAKWISELAFDYIDNIPELGSLLDVFANNIDMNSVKNNVVGSLSKASFSPYKVKSYSIYKSMALQEIELDNYEKAYEMFRNIVEKIKFDKGKKYSMYYTYWNAENLIYLGFCAFCCKLNNDETQILNEAYNILDTIGIIDKFDLIYLYVYGHPFNHKTSIKPLSTKDYNSNMKVSISFSNICILVNDPSDVNYECKISVDCSGIFSEWGLIVWQGNEKVASIKRADNPCHSDSMNIWLKSKEYGISLTEKTEYTCRFYVVFDGVTYYSDTTSYRTGSAKEDVPVPVQITFSEQYAAQKGYDFNDVTFYCNIVRANRLGNFTESGLTIWKGSKEIKAIKNTCHLCKSNHMNIWFNSKTYGISLTEDTEYTYRFYVVFDGVTYYSDTISYRTGENVYLKL